MSFEAFVMSKLARGHAFGSVADAYARRKRAPWTQGRTAPAEVRHKIKPIYKKYNPVLFSNNDSTKERPPSDEAVVPNLS